jgi:hypothetical protein
MHQFFHLHGVDRHDQPKWKAKLKRAEWLSVLHGRLVLGAENGMAAWTAAHDWVRKLQERGFRVKLIRAQFVQEQQE